MLTQPFKRFVFLTSFLLYRWGAFLSASLMGNATLSLGCLFLFIVLGSFNPHLCDVVAACWFLCWCQASPSLGRCISWLFGLHGIRRGLLGDWLTLFFSFGVFFCRECVFFLFLLLCHFIFPLPFFTIGCPSDCAAYEGTICWSWVVVFFSFSFFSFSWVFPE